MTIYPAEMVLYAYASIYAGETGLLCRTNRLEFSIPGWAD